MTRKIFPACLGIVVAALAHPTCRADDNAQPQRRGLSALRLANDESTQKAGRVKQSALKALEYLSNSQRKKLFRINLTLVEVQEETDVNQLAIKVHPHPFERWNGRKHLFTNLDCAKCHRLNVGGKGNDMTAFLKNRHFLKTFAANAKGVKVLASPQLLVTAGRAATMNAKSARKFQYFRKEKDGRFTLKEETIETGITIKATVQTASDGNVRLQPLSVSVTAIKDREKIPGVNLPVGKPVLTTTSISTSVLSKLGKSSVISIDSPRSGRVLISVNVSHSPPKKTSSLTPAGVRSVYQWIQQSRPKPKK